MSDNRYLRRAALRGALVEFEFTIPKSVRHDLDKSYAHLYPMFVKRLREIRGRLGKNKALKFQLKVQVSFAKYSFELEREIRTFPYFNSPAMSVVTHNQIISSLKKSYDSILDHYDTFVHKGSGWELRKVLKFVLVVYRYQTFKGGCLTEVLPRTLANKHACISVKCKDDQKCFLYAVAASIANVQRNPQRLLKLYDLLIEKLPKKLVLTFPVSLKQIAKFEKVAPVSINVYGFDKVAFPYYITNFRNKKYHVNLLLYKNHYWPIKNMSALICGQTRNNKAKHYVCDYCLCYFSSEKRYHMHMTMCKRDGLKYTMPKSQEKYMAFSNYQHLIEAPFVIYADLESYIEKKKINRKGKRISKSKHVCLSTGAMAICRPNDTFSSAPCLFTDPRRSMDQLLEFLDQQLEFYSCLREHLCYPMIFTDEDAIKFEAAHYCYLCRVPFHAATGKCRDHCHLSGKYRGALCNTCNLTYGAMPKNIFVIFHGLSNYDSHFIVRRLHRYRNCQIRIIPKSSEKYLSFSVGNIHYKDSYQFLSESLATLADNLKEKGEEYFIYINKHIKHQRQRELMKRKGVFPYSYIDSPQRLSETSLPPITCFKNDLRGDEIISQEEYNVAMEVWKEFKCHNLRDYMEVYLRADILLLADIFENFRSRCMTDYELDPVFYYSLAHYSFDAFLRFSNVTFELLTDINMYLYISEAIRGGVSMVCGRRSHVENKYTREDIDPKESAYILYLDANNLYGYAMCESVPYADFHWVEDLDEFQLDYIMSLPSDGEYGYIYEVSFRYPRHLHDDHVDLPLAPHRKKVPYNDLSPVARLICDKHNLKRSTNTPKLMTTLEDKSHYILHYRNLQLYVLLGLVVTKIHRGLRFRQAPVMRTYVEFNTAKRSKAKDAFDRCLYKLIVNSLFGKTLENPCNRMIVELISDVKRYEKLVSKLNFKSCKVIHKKLVSAQMRYISMKVNKPFYIGMTILDLSKALMYNFHYNVMKKKYGNALRLLYTDTDSLIYEIQCEDVYKDLKDMSEKYFDFSNYPKDHPLFSEINKKQVGYFKDELGGDIATDFVGLRAKMYCYLVNSHSTEYKKARGVKKYVIENRLRFEDYLRCLAGNESVEADYKSIQSTRHQVHTVHQSKLSLCPFDDKRYLLNFFESIPYGHYVIPKNKEAVESATQQRQLTNIQVI